MWATCCLVSRYNCAAKKPAKTDFMMPADDHMRHDCEIHPFQAHFEHLTLTGTMLYSEAVKWGQCDAIKVGHDDGS